MIPTITFQEALKFVNNANECHVLLGNGFSIALNKDLFSYKSIHETAKYELNDKIAHLFEDLNTRDYEKVINELENTAKTIEICFDNHNYLSDQLIREAHFLRKILIETIVNHHPTTADDIWPDQYETSSMFLKNFKTVFTTNYDLLIYWTCLNNETFKLDDGFRRNGSYLNWEKNNTQNLFYLHGGLHIFKNYSYINKLSFSQSGIPLIIQINHELQNNRYPLIVTEGNSNDKLYRIMSDNYLRFCYEKLSNIKGALFIYGFSMSNNDSHILKAIEHSRIEQLFVSLYGVKSPESFKIYSKLEALKLKRSSYKPLSIQYFDAENVKIWNKQLKYTL